MNGILKSVLLLLSAANVAIDANTVQCSQRNYDPCVTFPDLCLEIGATCRFKAPCEYECVCPPDATGCTGSQGSSGNSDVRPHESESLLVFSPNLFDDFLMVNQPPATTTTNSTSSPTTVTTTTTASTSTPTSSAAVETAKATASATTTSTPSTTNAQPTTATTAAATSAAPASAAVAAAAMVERRQVLLSNDVLDDFEPISQTLDGEPGNAAEPQQNASRVSPATAQTPKNNPPPQSAEQSLFTEKASRILTAASSKQEIQQILENIKSSFQLLTSHILGSENRSAAAAATTTTSSPPASPTASFTTTSSSSGGSQSSHSSFSTPTSAKSPMKTA